MNLSGNCYCGLQLNNQFKQIIQEKSFKNTAKASISFNSNILQDKTIQCIILIKQRNFPLNFSCCHEVIMFDVKNNDILPKIKSFQRAIKNEDKKIIVKNFIFPFCGFLICDC